jgi:DNA-binding NtrC family response regulator
LDEAAQGSWLDYKFPGNVRELRNITVRLIAKYSGKTISASQLLAEFDLTESELDELNSDILNINDESGLMTQARRHLQRQVNVSLDEVLKTWEKAYIEAAMQLTHGNLSQAAKLLNVNRTTLYSRMSATVDN